MRPATRAPATDEAAFDEVYAVNVKAPYFLTAAIAAGMADAGRTHNPDGGRTSVAVIAS